jgi:hypothetical protein
VEPVELAREPDLAFVDGIQNLEARVMATDDQLADLPSQGIVVSYAAGALYPRRQPAIKMALAERRVILGAGRKLGGPITLRAQNGSFDYAPASCAEDTPEALEATFRQLRAALEAQVVSRLIDQQCELIVVDGRLPPVVSERAVGLIKTPHHIPLSREQAAVLSRLRTGERSPVFKRSRSDRVFYDWFLCLRTPSRFESPWSGLALLEVDDAVGQNLLPVGQLERDLRRRLGDPVLLHRLLRRCIGTEDTPWV